MRDREVLVLTAMPSKEECQERGCTCAGVMASAIVARRRSRKTVEYKENVLAAAGCEADEECERADAKPQAKKGKVVARGACEIVVSGAAGGGTRAIVHSMEASRKSLLGKKVRAGALKRD